MPGARDPGDRREPAAGDCHVERANGVHGAGAHADLPELEGLVGRGPVPDDHLFAAGEKPPDQ